MKTILWYDFIQNEKIIGTAKFKSARYLLKYFSVAGQNETNPA